MAQEDPECGREFYDDVLGCGVLIQMNNEKRERSFPCKQSSLYITGWLDPKDDNTIFEKVMCNNKKVLVDD